MGCGQVVWGLGPFLSAVLLSAVPAAAELPPASQAGPQLEVSGRVFARAGIDDRPDAGRSLSIPSARLGVAATLPYVQAVVEADLAKQNNMLRDAYIRLKDESGKYRFFAGKFKAPFLARQLESAWRLPVIQRGLVEDYLVDRNELGGRRFGALGQIRFKRLSELSFSAGLFEGSEDPISGKRLGEDFSARVGIAPWKALSFGASGYLSEAFTGASRQAAATDATFELGAFALSAELSGGKLPQGRFFAQTAVASYDLPLTADGRWVLQPLLGGEALSLRGPTGGQASSLVAGANLLVGENFKLQLQGERAQRVGDSTPGNELLIQMAARF